MYLIYLLVTINKLAICQKCGKRRKGHIHLPHLWRTKKYFWTSLVKRCNSRSNNFFQCGPQAPVRIANINLLTQNQITYTNVLNLSMSTVRRTLLYGMVRYWIFEYPYSTFLYFYASNRNKDLHSNTHTHTHTSRRRHRNT